MNEVMEVQERRSSAGEVPVENTNTSTTGTPIATENTTAGPLLPPDFVQDLRSRWDRIQTAFVDEPRAAVKQADELVDSAVKRLSESFTEARNNLERQWDRGDEVSTEELRVALTKYRSFFQKLMTV